VKLDLEKIKEKTEEEDTQDDDKPVSMTEAKVDLEKDNQLKAAVDKMKEILADAK